MDEKVAAHRLAGLVEGLWLDRETARKLIEDGVDPQEFIRSIRQYPARDVSVAGGEAQGRGNRPTVAEDKRND